MCISLFGFYNSPFTVWSGFQFQIRRLIRSQSYICSPFGFAGLFIPPTSNFLSLTSDFTRVHQSEVRDDCVHWLCLSAWVIHGNGKVQTGAVGGLGFLPFSLLDAFFLKSLTNPKLQRKYAKRVAPFFFFSLHPTKTSGRLCIDSCHDY